MIVKAAAIKMNAFPARLVDHLPGDIQMCNAITTMLTGKKRSESFRVRKARPAKLRTTRN